MIGVHIYNNTIAYQTRHASITRLFGEYTITICYHEKYDKQVFYENEDYCVFLDGWIFNSPSYQVQAEFVLEEYLQNPKDFIYSLNGQFNLVICKKSDSTFIYYSDIFSLRKHYYMRGEDQLILSSDFTFIMQNIHNKNVNVDHVRKSLELPRFVDIAETYIEEIKQVLPRSIITDDNISQYSFDKVRSNFESKETDPVLLLDKIKKIISQTHKEDPLLLLLTGGLDSRFLLETFVDINLNVQTATYGNEIGDEVQIAKNVARANNVEHFPCQLDAEDFIVDAKEYVMNVGGLDIFVQSTIYKFFNYLQGKVKKGAIIETGFALDMFLGGSQLNADINHDLAIENRVFSALSVRQSAIREFHEDRYSMYNYELYFLMRSLPKSLIEDNKFYYPLCCLQIKNSFHIPLQSTMFDLSLDPSSWKEAQRIQKHKEDYALEYFRKNKKPIFHNRYYSDFDMWIRSSDKWIELIKSLFLNTRSILSQHFVDQERIEKSLDEHLTGEKSHRRDIIKWTTLELFFQQVDLINNKDN